MSKTFENVQLSSPNEVSAFRIFVDFAYFSVSLGALGTLFGHSWGALGYFGVLLGSLGAIFGALLGRSGALLGRSWAALGRSWGALGRSWGTLGGVFGGLGPSRMCFFTRRLPRPIFIRFPIDFSFLGGPTLQIHWQGQYIGRFGIFFSSGFLEGFWDAFGMFFC